MNTKNKRNKIYSRLATILLVVVGLLIVENVKADGSRDLYPSGATGYRAYLASNNNAVSGALPYGSRGTHYVYARVGEKIALASSEWAGNSALKLFDPDGIDVSPARGTVGRIQNRTQELAGPKLSTSDNSSNRYTPVYYTVQKEGIHRVEFWPYTNVNSAFQNTARSGPVGGWTNFTGQSSYIAAWDVTVINSASTDFIPGRVYANMLNMGILASTSASQGFYGKMYVLTKDGYTYRVDNNGNNGIVFSFFVNNNGFVKGLQSNGSVDYTPLYKSLPNIDSAISNKQVWNPTEPDNEQNITHKMFYTLPSEDLPKNTLVYGAVPGGATWLKNDVIEPQVMDVKIEGSDGTEGQASTKGGFIKFNTESQGSYTVKIISEGTPAFPTRYLYGTAVAGENRIFWDGRDGNNVPVPSGMTPAKITVQLQGAEVHFPYFDMEHNINGIKLELLNHELLPEQEITVSDIVYWNDVDINNVSTYYGVNANPKNNSHLPASLGGAGSLGLSSADNGHKWGGGSSNTGTFGDVRAMDTWTFIKGEEESIQTEVVIKRADLKITELSVDNGTIKIDEEITYTVKVKNGEPDDGGCPIESAPFSFILPQGFVPAEEFIPVFSGNSCGCESVALVYDEVTNTYLSSLDLPNGCEISYTFKVKVTEESDPANTKATATIMRPNDVTDPDATNTSNPANPIAPEGVVDLDAYYYLPTDPFFEVEYNGEGGVSNNIKDIPVGLTRESDLAIIKTADVDEAKIGDVVTFTLTVTNNGPHVGVGVVVTDNVPTGYTINNSTISNDGVVVNNVITWNIGDLGNQQQVVLTFKATVKDAGSYLNIATVDGDVEDPDLTNNESSIDPVLSKNYWIGGTTDKKNDWAEPKNWTAERVPDELEDIEFATETNNPTDINKPSSGPAREDLHLDKDRIIGDLINKSDKDLIVTLENELVIHGKVHDDNTGGIVVNAANDKAMGTLRFEDPVNNSNVDATVQFYNKAYECDDCGFFRKQWQYFGVPVKSREFPFDDVMGTETVNSWDETYNGDKWRPTTGELSAFVGYQITNNVTTLPTGVYNFNGKLTVGDATVALTKTPAVNYSGTNLVSNSYTAAIPISEDAITFPTRAEQTVYLFNTGTRDQWRKLNGQAINQDGYRSGQYLAVPVNLGGTLEFPDRIPSTHSFMILTEGSGDLHINYMKLTKNTKVNRGDGTQIVTRSVGNSSASVSGVQNNKPQMPSLVMDVIGEESADRVWIFQKQGASHDFNNGWDGRKMLEDGIAQLYVSAADDSKLQVATVPELNSVSLGFIADIDGEYTFEFAQTGQLKGTDIYLHDAVTGNTHKIGVGKSYSFTSKRGEPTNRFRLSSKDNGTFLSADEDLLDVSTKDGGIMIVNASSKVVSVFVYDSNGVFVQRVEVHANGKTSIESGLVKGMYMIRLQNSDVNDVRRVTVE